MYLDIPLQYPWENSYYKYILMEKAFEILRFILNIFMIGIKDNMVINRMTQVTKFNQDFNDNE